MGEVGGSTGEGAQREGAREAGGEGGMIMLRIFDGYGEALVSLQHQHGKIGGDVRVLINEDTDHREVVSTLLRIAHWIEEEARMKECCKNQH